MTDSAPQFTAIAAMGRNRVIGKDGKLPWDRIPEDMRFFREKTLHSTVIMGRKTQGSLQQPLPDRWNLVLSQTGVVPSGFYPLQGADDIKHMLTLGQSPKHFVIGGGQIYKLLMPWTTEILLTVIDQEPEGDTFFPEFESEFGEPEILQAIPGVEWRRYFRKLI